MISKPTPPGSSDLFIRGILGWAQRRCSGVAFASNHWHALISVDDAEQLARFMQYVDGNIAREVGALVGWSAGASTTLSAAAQA
jgi:hypothetical protein